jgi:hypothetical protein
VPISNYEIAEILSDVVGKKITYVDVSDSAAREGMMNAGIQEWTMINSTFKKPVRRLLFRMM